MSLKQDFFDVVEGYMDAFCKKHDVTVDHWPGNDIGGVCGLSNDTFLNFDDIRMDIDRDLPKQMIWEWYYAELEAHWAGVGSVNLDHWSNGARHKAPATGITGPQATGTEAIIEKALEAIKHIDNAIGNSMDAGLSDSEAMKVVHDSMPAIDAGLSVAVRLHGALRSIQRDIQEHLDHE